MRGKAGVVLGLAVGYVLGTRAGRERYEQIKTQADKVWSAEPVQRQVVKVKEFAASAAMALPTTLWNSAVKVTKAAASKGTAEERVERVKAAGAESADEIQKTAKVSARAAKQAADDLSTEGSGS